MTLEEYDNEVRDMLPVDMITKEKFEKIKTISKLDFTKLMKEDNIPDMTLKMCCWYYDFYKDKDYDDELQKQCKKN